MPPQRRSYRKRKSTARAVSSNLRRPKHGKETGPITSIPSQVQNLSDGVDESVVQSPRPVHDPGLVDSIAQLVSSQVRSSFKEIVEQSVTTALAEAGIVAKSSHQLESSQASGNRGTWVSALCQFAQYWRYIL